MTKQERPAPRTLEQAFGPHCRTSLEPMDARLPARGERIARVVLFLIAIVALSAFLSTLFV
jgi:hypothetical protein